MKILTVFCILFSSIIVFAIDESVDSIHYQLGMNYYKEKKYDAAIEEFRKMLTLYPEHSKSYYQMGLSWNAMGKYALGVYNLKKAVKFDQKNPVFLKDLAGAYAKNGETEKAMSVMRECIDAETDTLKKAENEKEIQKLLETSRNTTGTAKTDTVKTSPNVLKPVVVNGKQKSDTLSGLKALPGQAKPIKPIVSEGKLKSDTIAGTKQATVQSKKNLPTDTATVNLVLPSPSKQAVPVDTSTKGKPVQEVSSDTVLKDLLVKFNAGQWDDVLTLAKNIIKKSKGHPGAYYYAGVARYKKGDLKDAMINFQKGIAYPDKGINALYYLGLINESWSNYEQALSSYQQYINKTDNIKGREEVKARMEAIRKRSKTSPQQPIIQASNAPKQGPVELVIPKDTAKPAPLHFKITENMEFIIEDTLSREGRKMVPALDLFLESRYDEALNKLKTIYREAPKSKEADNSLYDIGLIYSRMRLWDNSCTYLDKIMNEYPKGDVALQAGILKASVLAEKGALDSALKQCQASLALLPAKSTKQMGYLITLMGDIYLEKNDLKNALKQYIRAMEFAKPPESKAELNYKIGECYFKDGSTRGIEYFKQAVSDTALKTDAVMESCYRLGDYYYKIKNMEGALKYYLLAVERYPQSINTSWGMYQTGNVYKKGGRFNEATKTYDKLMAAYPGDYWALQAKWQREDALWENEFKEVIK